MVNDGARPAAVLLGLAMVALAFKAPWSRSGWRDLVGDGLRPRWLLIAFLVGALAATAVTSRPLLYPVHVLLTLGLHALAWISLVTAAAQARALGADHLVDRALSSERTGTALAIGACALCLLIGRAIFDGIPHIPDEVVFLLQATYLSSGDLYVEGIPPAALDVISTYAHDGRWFGIFPVGWPAILAIGVRLGAPWVVNPILAGVALVAAHGLIHRISDLRTANLATFFLATSPWMLFLGGSYMSHTAAILTACLAVRGAVEVSASSRVGRWSVGGGIALGVLVLVRPFEGVLVGLLCAAVVLAARRSLRATGSIAAFALIAVAVGALTLPYNRALTGNALLDPITEYFDSQYYQGANRLGFGADVGNLGWGNDALPGHSPFEALINASWNASLVQLELFGWAFGSLAVLLVGLGAIRRWIDPPLAGALGFVVAVFLSYALYWYSAADFGPRYWSQMIVPLAALTAASLLRLFEGGSLRRMTVLASLIGLPVVVAMRGSIKYQDYRGMTRDIERLAEREGFGHELVLIRGDVFSDFSPGLILNPRGWEGPGPLYFRWVDGEDLSALRDRFPDRRIRVVDGASLAGGRPRIALPPAP